MPFNVEDILSGGKSILEGGANILKENSGDILKYGLPAAATAYNIFGRDPVLPQNPIRTGAGKLTELGNVLTKQAKEGSISPIERRSILGATTAQTGNIAQNVTAATRGRLARTGMEGSIAGVRALAEPELRSISEVANKSVDLDIENARTKQAATTQIASLLTQYEDNLQRALTAEDQRKNDALLMAAFQISNGIQAGQDDAAAQDDAEMWRQRWLDMQGGDNKNLNIDWGNLDLWPNELIDQIRNLNPRLDWEKPGQWGQDIWNLISGFGGPSSWGEWGVRNPVFRKDGDNNTTVTPTNNTTVTPINTTTTTDDLGENDVSAGEGFFQNLADVGSKLLVGYVIEGFWDGAKDFYGQKTLEGVKRRGFSEKFIDPDELAAQAAVLSDPQNESLFSGKSSGELVKYFTSTGTQNKAFAQGGMNDVNKMFGTAELAKNPNLFKSFKGGMSVKDLQTIGAESATSKRFVEARDYYTEFVADFSEQNFAQGKSPADVAEMLKSEEATIIPLMTKYINEGGAHPRDVIGQQATQRSIMDVTSVPNPFRNNNGS